MDFYLIVIFSDRIQQHVRVFTLREESAARCFKGSSTGWISRCVCWLLMSFSTRQQAHRGGGAWQRLSRVWALICCVVGPIWTHSAVIWWNPRAWWTTAHSCNVELNVKLNDFCSPSTVLTGKYMLKETKSQGIHLKTKLRSRKLVGRTNSCFFLPFLLCWGGNLSDRGERWFPPPERRPGRWSWSETCRCRDGEARRHCETRTAAGSISLSSLTAGVFLSRWSCLLRIVWNHNVTVLSGILCYEIFVTLQIQTSDTKHFLPHYYCHLQDPVDGHDERDVIWRQAHWCQYDHHGNQTGLRDPRCPDASSCSCDAAGQNNTHEDNRRRSREFTGPESDAIRTKKQFRTRASGTLSG